MGRRLAAALVALPVAAAVAALPATAAWAEPVGLVAIANGANEVGGGDAQGSATAAFALDADAGLVCYAVQARNLPRAVGMHIHRGAAGANGPVVVPLDESKTNGERTCTTADAAVISAIVGNPGGYYFNLHTQQFPDGAVRGQLAVAPTGVPAGSGGLLDDEGGLPVLPIALVLAGAGVAAAGGWRLVRR
jgi:hypothetical protein